MNPVVRQTMVFALQEAGGGTVCLSNVLHGSLLAYSTSWEDCSEVVLRLPEASDNKTGTLDPPNGATGRETGQKQGSNESSTPEIEPWDPVMDPLGPRNWSESPKN